MRIYMAGIFAMGFQIACQQSFMALGQAKVSLLLACLRKIILLIPLIFILPHLHEQLMQKYQDNMRMVDRIPEALSGAMGNQMYMM